MDFGREGVMGQQPRITPDEALDAYRVTGLRPVFGRYADGDTCGCPLVALKHRITGDGFGVLDWADEIFGKWYTIDFIVGVDATGDNIGRHLTEGYADGRAVRQAIIEAGLMEAVG